MVLPSRLPPSQLGARGLGTSATTKIKLYGDHSLPSHHADPVKDDDGIRQSASAWTHALRRGSVSSHLLETSFPRAGHKRFETKGSNRSDGPRLGDRTPSCLNGGPGQDAGREVVAVGAMHLDAVDQLAGGRARIRHDQGPRA